MCLDSTICEGLMGVWVCPYVSKEMEGNGDSGQCAGNRRKGCGVWPTTCQPNSKTTNKRKEIELGAILSFHTYVVIFLGRAVT